MKLTKIASTTLVLTALAIASNVKAQEDRTPRVAIRNAPTVLEHQTTPFNLVNLAYRGYFQDIPSYTQLAQAYLFGRVDAANLVKAGIEQGRISPETLDNEAYLNAVDARLRRLSSNQ